MSWGRARHQTSRMPTGLKVAAIGWPCSVGEGRKAIEIVAEVGVDDDEWLLLWCLDDWLLCRANDLRRDDARSDPSH